MTRRLQIRYPIIQPPMAAVSNAGGLGSIAGCEHGGSGADAAALQCECVLSRASEIRPSASFVTDDAMLGLLLEQKPAVVSEAAQCEQAEVEAIAEPTALGASCRPRS
jgi:NAD(P)H-dependent flavin oxidoreductase YrpB (nitropropane dioxygenase family)